MRHFLISFFCLFALTACQAEVSFETKGADRGKAKITDFNTEANTRVALIDKRKLEGEAKPELNYGSMDANFITLDGTTYMVHWNDTEDFKNIKRGEQMNFRASDYVARLEKKGQNYKVIFLNEF